MLERFVGIFQAHEMKKAFQAAGMACAKAQRPDAS